jgi:hypothetical protein
LSGTIICYYNSSYYYFGYRPGSDIEKPHITLKVKNFRTQESGCDGAKIHDGRRLQFDDCLKGIPEEAIQDAKGWIGDIIDDDDNLAPKFVRVGFHDCVGGCNMAVGTSTIQIMLAWLFLFENCDPW